MERGFEKHENESDVIGIRWLPLYKILTTLYILATMLCRAFHLATHIGPSPALTFCATSDHFTSHTCMELRLPPRADELLKHFA